MTCPQASSNNSWKVSSDLLWLTTQYSASRESMYVNSLSLCLLHTIWYMSTLPTAPPETKCFPTGKAKATKVCCVVVAVSAFQGRHQPLLCYKVYLYMYLFFCVSPYYIYCSTTTDYATSLEGERGRGCCWDLRNLSNWKWKQKLKIAGWRNSFGLYKLPSCPWSCFPALRLYLRLTLQNVSRFISIYISIEFDSIQWLKEKQKFFETTTRMK